MPTHSSTLAWKSHGGRRLVGCSPWRRWGSDTTERLHFHFHALEKGMAIHSSVLAWRIPGMGKPDGLPSMGSHRVGHDWSYLAAAAAVPIKLTTITERGRGKGKKKEKKIQKNLQNNLKKIINIFLESLLSESFPLQGVTVHLTSLGCPPTLCWSLDLQ